MNAIATRRPLIEAPLELRRRSGGEKARDAAFIICPKCDAPCTIRRSERITPTVKHLTAICTNSGCGHTFLCEVAFVHSFSPGLIDRPDLNLKQCPREQVPHVLPPSRDGPVDQISMFEG